MGVDLQDVPSLGRHFHGLPLMASEMFPPLALGGWTLAAVWAVQRILLRGKLKVVQGMVFSKNAQFDLVGGDIEKGRGRQE